jgi:hypothetical protein
MTEKYGHTHCAGKASNSLPDRPYKVNQLWIWSQPSKLVASRESPLLEALAMRSEDITKQEDSECVVLICWVCRLVGVL